ncbi:hypothetical protein FLAG1_01448 [Fusarium langsethiae]|uniref:Uncharacterized protein n=1 Tax=Fusarium langsethiae TaxID=179993 RepID=A0A0M9F4C4_FUSLA|nr:hypothetical protein FLAG1_01448 [Fusarium langsethiae]
MNSNDPNKSDDDAQLFRTLIYNIPISSRDIVVVARERIFSFTKQRQSKATHTATTLPQQIPVTMDPTAQELSDIRKRISETMAYVSKEQQELDEIIQFINRIEQFDLQQMSGSASSARGKRNKAQVKSVKEEKEDYECRRAKKQESLGLMWRKIHELQERERELTK